MQTPKEGRIKHEMNWSRPGPAIDWPRWKHCCSTQSIDISTKLGAEVVMDSITEDQAYSLKMAGSDKAYLLNAIQSFLT